MPTFYIAEGYPSDAEYGTILLAAGWDRAATLNPEQWHGDIEDGVCFWEYEPDQAPRRTLYRVIKTAEFKQYEKWKREQPGVFTNLPTRDQVLMVIGKWSFLPLAEEED